MEWITDERPPYTGPYLVSVKRQREHGIEIFKYVAYYVGEQNEWYKYDPFENNYIPHDRIEGHVTAWADNTSVHSG
jgi:hypothetical protein